MNPEVSLQISKSHVYLDTYEEAIGLESEV
jgi:hypothetical protein